MCIRDRYNLLSILKLTKDSKCIAIFHPQFCIIPNYATKKITGVGREHRGLYFLKDQPLNGVDIRMENIIKNLLESEKEKLLVAGAANGSKVLESYEVWHKRLGHAPLNNLKQLPNVQLRVTENKVCVTCPMAKFTRQPFQPSISRSTRVCEMIHMDIWGPYRIPTHRNFRDFLTLVDDYTRTTWVYLLKQKSEVLSTFQQFMTFVSTQFQAIVKVVRSDNALESHSDPCQ